MSEPKTPVTGEETPKLHQALVAVEERYIHSDVFDKLVRGPNDIPGLVAYGIYQVRKREWIAKHHKQYNCFRPKQK